MTQPAPRLVETPGNAAMEAAPFGEAVVGMRRVGLDGVLGDLDRKATQPVRLPVRAAAYGFRWNWTDMADREWWPQGITTSGEANASGRVFGLPVVAVSWYAKPVAGAPSRGSRVSFIDVTDPASPRYTHVLLVEPAVGPGTWHGEWKPVRIHAGGLAWYGDHLIAVDTRGGLRVFDLDNIVRIDSPRDEFRFLLPQRMAYRHLAHPQAGHGASFRYSFVSIDRTGPEHGLIVGEYGGSGTSSRLARYQLDQQAAMLRVDDAGSEEPRSATPQQLLTGVARMQGAVTVGATTYLSTSRGRFRRGTMWTMASAGGGLREHRRALAIGPEDLTYWPQRDQLWSVSEYPGRFPRRRFVYAMPRTEFPSA